MIQRTPSVRPPSGPVTGRIPGVPILPKGLSLANIGGRRRGVRIKKPRIKKGKLKARQALVPDLFAKRKSLRMFGKATPIKPGSKLGRQVSRKQYVRVPTKELAKYR